MNVTVERINGTQVEQWSFYLMSSIGMGTKFVLDTYILGEQKSKRHKVVVSKKYSRIGRRDFEAVQKHDVPLPDDVIAEAKQAFFDRITFEP